MFTLMMLFALAVIGTIAFSAVLVAALLFKAALHIALLPLKLLFLPFLAIMILVKVAVLFAVGAVLFAVLLPLLILGAIVAAPFLIASLFA